MQKKLKWVLLVSSFLCAVIFLTSRPSPVYPAPEIRAKILEEIASADEGITRLAPDNSGTMIAFKGNIQGEPAGTADEGYTIGLVDLRTLEATNLPATYFPKFVGDWSPDDRYLAFVRNYTIPAGATTSNVSPVYERIGLYDRITGSVTDLTSIAKIKERELTWLGDRDYVVAVLGDKENQAGFYRGRVGSESRTQIARFWNKLTMVDPDTGAFARNQQIYLLDVSDGHTNGLNKWDGGTNGVVRISNFVNDVVGGIEWLNYCAGSSNYLFCARPRESNWRFLFQYDPMTTKLTQLSFEDTYNGQWLLDGGGYAYVVNTNSTFYLAIRTFDGTGNTNLFTDGNVILYRASPDGQRVYAVASLGCEPHGIWEYTVTNRALRKVYSGMGTPFEASKPADTTAFLLPSFDKVQLPCFLLEPRQKQELAEVAANAWYRNVRRPKYPCVIHIPASTYQFQRRFEHQAQLFANFGFYFAAINYRGCDGYGKEFSKLANAENAAKDVLELREWLLANTDVDPDNIFLTTTSGGLAVVNQLLIQQPGLWAGVAMDKPGSIHINPRFEPGQIPPILGIFGGQDSLFDLQAMNSFADWAKTNDVIFRYVIHTNSSHITHSAAHRKDILKQMSDFFFEHLR